MTRVLIVEDTPDVLEILVSALEGQGYQVAGAQTGEEALRIMQGAPPRLAVFDLVLPDCDGMSLAAEAGRLGIPHLLMTGDQATAAELNAAGHRCLAKPFSITALAGALRDSLLAISGTGGEP